MPLFEKPLVEFFAPEAKSSVAAVFKDGQAATMLAPYLPGKKLCKELLATAAAAQDQHAFPFCLSPQVVADTYSNLSEALASSAEVPPQLSEIQQLLAAFVTDRGLAGRPSDS